MRITKPLAVAILYVAGASCLPITLLAESSSRNLPLSPPSPRNMAQCDQLQSQWDAVRQQIQNQHQQCLNAHSHEPSNPSGSGPGSACSHAACQSLHTELFTILAPQEKTAVQQCRNQVAQFQQQQAQAASANQPPYLPAQTSLQVDLSQLRAQAQRLSVRANQNAQAAQAAQLQSLLRQAQANALAEARIHQQSSGVKTTADSVITDGQPIPPAALDSSDPDVQGKIQQIQRLDKDRADIQALQADQLKSAPDDVTAAMLSVVLSPSEILKGSADATATAIGLEGGPVGKAFSAGYGIVTNVVGQAAERFADGGNTWAVGTNGSENSELSGKISEGVSSLGELLKEDQQAASATRNIGGPLEGVGNAVAVGINATQGYDAYNEGNYMDAATKSASAIGGTAKVAGQLGEALDISGSTALKGSGESIAAAAGLAQAGQTLVKGLSDAWDSYGAPERVLQQYSNALSNETAVVQRLTDERNAAYLELLNLLYQKSNGTVSVSVPGPTPSPNPAPQKPIPILFP